MFDFFSGHHEIVVFNYDSPMNNEGQVNDRWPNYVIDFSVDKSNFNHLRMFFNPRPVCVLLLNTEMTKIKCISRLKYMEVTYLSCLSETIPTRDTLHTALTQNN